MRDNNKIYQIDFWKYDKKNELPDGLYWKLLMKDDNGKYIYSDELLKSESIYIYVVNYFDELKNEELKEEIKNRILEYIINFSVRMTRIYNFKMFNSSELKKILDNEISILRRNLNEENRDKCKRILNDNFDAILPILADKKLEYSVFKKYVNSLFDMLNVEKLELFDYDICLLNTKKLLEIKHLNKKLFDEIVKEFKYPIFDILFKTDEVNNDHLYIYNKAKEKFSNIRIGIDPNISIGLEVEINSLINAGFNIDLQKKILDIKEEIDITVYNGKEFVTSVMHDNSEDISFFVAFIDTLKELGYYYDKDTCNAAGQINLGLDYLDTKEAILNFFEIYGNVEKLLFYISNEKDSLIRNKIYDNTRFNPISGLIGKRNIDELDSREDILRMFYIDDSIFSKKEELSYDGYDEYKNELGFGYKRNTVGVRDLDSKDSARLEFRIPNGSSNYETWIDNIRLYAKIMEVAKYLADLKDKDYLSDREIEMLNLKEELYFADSLEEKLNILMDLLFTEERIKNIYKERFYNTLKNIIKTGTDKYNPLCDCSEKVFKSVQFIDKNNGSRLIASYDIVEGYKEYGRRLSR